MPDYITAKEAALKWGITDRRLLALCNARQIPGAFKDGKVPCDFHYFQPKQKHFPCILIELKAEKNADTSSLKKLSEKALAQISKKACDTSIRSGGTETVFKYGVAFSGRCAEVTVI